MNIANSDALASSLDQEPAVTMESLDRMALIVSNEAMLPSQFLTAVTTKLPEFFRRAKMVIATSLNSVIYDDFDRVDSGALQRAIKNIPYLNLVDDEFPVPIGMKVSYKMYLSMISAAQDGTDQLIEGTLKPLQQHISVLLNDPTKMANIGTGVGVNYARVDVDKLQKLFVGMMDSKSNIGNLAFGKAFERVTELKEVDRMVQTAVGRYQAIGTAKVQRMVDDINVLVETLLQRVDEEPEAYKFSGPVLRHLVERVHSAAQQVEFYGVIGYRIKSVTASLNAGYKKMAEQYS